MARKHASDSGTDAAATTRLTEGDSVEASEERNGPPARPELLMSAALHLMSQYAAGEQESGACVRLAAVIERHLKALAELPGLEPVLRATCRQLSEQWADLVDRRVRPAPAPGLLMRLVAPLR